MNQAFTEMMKGFDSWKSWDMPKNMEMFNTSDAARMGARFIDFQKNAFTTSFETMLKMQEQSQKVAAAFMENNSAIPAPGRALLDQWQAQLSNNQTEFQKYITDHYDRVLEMMQSKETEPKQAQSKDAQPNEKK
jgi:hypothetical protein